MLKVSVKWGKQKYDNVELDTNEPPVVFKAQLYALTGVPPDRQKVMGVKGGVLKDDAEWSKLGIKEGHAFMLVGTAGELPTGPVEKTVFLEDLKGSEAEVVSPYPPGLVNLGNTCYLNSTLQMLHAVPELNKALNGFRGSSGGGDPSENIATALKEVYQSLDHTRRATMPLEFLTLFRSTFPQFAEQSNGKFMQQDAEEAWTQLIQSLKRKLPALPGSSQTSGASANAISQLFGGEVTSELKCVEPGAEAEGPIVQRDEFTKLPCHISSNTNYLVDGLKEALVEEISKRSPTLNREALYHKTARLTRLPLYLTVQFVRFLWKQKANTKAKVCRPVDFPFTLDLYELCADEHKKRLDVRRKIKREEDEKEVQRMLASRGKEKETTGAAATPSATAPKTDADGDVAMSDSAAAEPITNPFENDTGVYDLKAIVTHKGRTADGGHYVAWVKQADNQWLLFDDDVVSMVNNDEIRKLVGRGGSDWHIAYLCLYGPVEKKTTAGEAAAASATTTTTTTTTTTGTK